MRLLDNGGLNTKGRTGWGLCGVHGPDADAGLRAPQNGCTPVYFAAQNWHDAVVQTLCREGADKNTPEKVWQGRAGEVERTNGVYVWLRVSSGLLTASVLTRVVQPCNVEWTGIAQVDLRARSWAAASF